MDLYRHDENVNTTQYFLIYGMIFQQTETEAITFVYSFYVYFRDG